MGDSTDNIPAVGVGVNRREAHDAYGTAENVVATGDLTPKLRENLLIHAAGPQRAPGDARPDAPFSSI